MLWLLKDVGASILGIAGLYLLCFGTLSRKDENESEPQQIRVWMTYVALTILSLGAIVWMVGRAINR